MTHRIGLFKRVFLNVAIANTVALLGGSVLIFILVYSSHERLFLLLLAALNGVVIVDTVSVNQWASLRIFTRTFIQSTFGASLIIPCALLVGSTYGVSSQLVCERAFFAWCVINGAAFLIACFYLARSLMIKQ